MKTIDSLVQASIDGKNYPGVILARLGFSTTQRYCNAYQTIYWDEDGGGEEAYLGLGHLASMSFLSETSELSAVTIQLSLSGIPNSTITDAFSNDYRGNPVEIWYGTLDKETYAVEYDTNPEDGPVLVFRGSMDFCNIEFGESASVTLNATSRLTDWERPRGGRFNHPYQTTYVDATDDGFEYVEKLQDQIISWGAYVIGDGGGSTGGGGQPGDDDHPNNNAL